MLELPNVTLFYILTEKDLHAAIDCEEHINFGCVVNVAELPTYEAYNRFMVKALHECFDTSHVLTVQWDGFVVDPSKWTDEFLQYDYIGAPIWNGENGCGGFSLRSKRFCEASATLDFDKRDYDLLRRRHIRPKDVPNEDFFLCIEKRAELESMGMRFAPIELADRFAWSKESGRIWPGSFGFHSPVSMEYLQSIGVIT